MAVPEIIVESTDEFQELINSKDFRIAKAIVEGILANMNTKKKHVHVLSVVCEDEEEIFDITVERKHFCETLDENLKYYVENEEYEGCQKIIEAIKLLKK
jgi:protein-arginine kinase activator protein McsA